MGPKFQNQQHKLGQKHELRTLRDSFVWVMSSIFFFFGVIFHLNSDGSMFTTLSDSLWQTLMVACQHPTLPPILIP